MNCDGYVLITLGLLFGLDNYQTVLSVLAHEFSHIKAKHEAERQSASFFWKVPEWTLRLLSFVPLLGLLPEALLTKYDISCSRMSREQITEADYIGMKLAATMGLHPQGAIDGLQIVHDWELKKTLEASERGESPPIPSTGFTSYPDVSLSSLDNESYSLHCRKRTESNKCKPGFRKCFQYTQRPLKMER